MNLNLNVKDGETIYRALKPASSKCFTNTHHKIEIKAGHKQDC